MNENLYGIFRGKDVDYADARYEKNRESSVAFEGREVRQARVSGRDGYNLRVYSYGRKACGGFSDFGSLKEGVGDLMRLNSASGNLPGKGIRLAPAPVLKDGFEIKPRSDPRGKSLLEKKKLLSAYNEIALKQNGVISTRFSYEDFFSRRTFVNSEGSSIEYELLICGISGLVVVEREGVVQTKRISFGGSSEFSDLEGREDDLIAELEIAGELPGAEPVKGGRFPVVLNPDLAAVFIHEAFGHLSEADITEDNPSFRKRLGKGMLIANEALSVYDDPSSGPLADSYSVDDEGVAARKTSLIRSGILSGRLHSRETAFSFGEPLSGNMRSVDCNFTPLIRMSNIYIEKGPLARDEVLSGLDDGFYLCNAKGGQTTGDQFTFGAEYGYRVEKGVMKFMVRDINISGELFSTLKRISAVADDLSFLEYGGCGKGSPMQLNRFSGLGAPHIRIDSVNVGGV